MKFLNAFSVEIIFSEILIPTYEEVTLTYLLEMSSSWNFPARASPSCEDSEPSQAELGHFNFQAETELTKILGPN